MRDGLIAENHLGHVVLDLTARGMNPDEVAGVLQADFALPSISGPQVQTWLTRELEDDRTKRALAIARTREGVQPLSIERAERELTEAAATFRAFIDETVAAYASSRATLPLDLRKFLSEVGCPPMSERQMQAFLGLVRRHSLDRAVQTAATASKELRGYLDLFLRARGRIQETPTVNILGIQEATADIMGKLCPECAARIAGIAPIPIPSAIVVP
ncbi:MAG: hypothetical protein WDA16_02035 [Candidatus Thermoplasmatota archaeon]